MKPEDLKLIVKEKYGEIAGQSKQQNLTSCCGSTGCCDDVDYTIFSDDYTKLAGYEPDADLGLGCGTPTEFAGLKAGQHVLDLGSGAGNDCFVARAFVGEKGQVTGIDFTDEMLEKANKNKAKLGFSNVNFVKGDIEEMPLEENLVDVVISNCVLNLVPDKTKAFSEIYRVLKPGGHFCVSDVVLKGELPKELKEDAIMYAGCVSGAIQQEDYLETIKAAGFTSIEVKKEKMVSIPNEILEKHIDLDKNPDIKDGKLGIFSVTVVAKK